MFKVGLMLQTVADPPDHTDVQRITEALRRLDDVAGMSDITCSPSVARIHSLISSRRPRRRD